MNRFTTPVEVIPFPWTSDHSVKQLFIGSCFTENVGDHLKELKFPVSINPFGILYNPVSVAGCLHRLLTGKPYSQEELFEYNGLWHSYSHHGRFSSPTAANTLTAINTALASGSDALREAGFLLITLGTAWVYELRATGQTVANCHKVPAREFHRYRLSVAETVSTLKDALDAIWSLNPGLRVILTISPVRHYQDGAIENQLSKAVLLLAADALVSGYGRDKCAYFPAYEIMMDELRDYRFYQPDMVHPSPVAVDYIREKFCEAFFTPEALALAQEITGVRKALSHRPLNPSTDAFQRFLLQFLEKTRLLSKNHPGLDFSSEIDYFSKQLAAFNTFPPEKPGKITAMK